MSFFAQLGNLRPQFLRDEGGEVPQFRYLFNYRRLWQVTILLMTAVAVLPFTCVTIIDYHLTYSAIRSEILLRTSRLASNAKRSIAFFLESHKAALDFVIHNNDLESLKDSKTLAKLLIDLDKSIGGFADLGIIDEHGLQLTYAGPYRFEGKNYSSQPWFSEVVDRGIHVSDVFLGYRQTPHLVIAVKSTIIDGSFYILRATIDAGQFNSILTGLHVSGSGEAFLINREGILQTPTRRFGATLDECPLDVPAFSEHTETYQIANRFDPSDNSLIVGYAYIPSTSLILMIVKQTDQLMQAWYKTRIEFVGFLVISIVIILAVILGMSTYLVNSVYITDRKRLTNLHQIESAAKLASIGRLAAGVAHEINNPLAIINMKAGLIRDLFTIKQQYKNDTRLMAEIDAITSSVDRCGTITKRLLSFARHMDVRIQDIQLEELIEEVLGFLGKEAEYRCIGIDLNFPADLPALHTDRGKLQQIFLNIINNAFAAMQDGGKLTINASQEDVDHISVTVRDTGCGISQSDVKRIFEPFFSTKKRSGGTGLGLSITYGLVTEIGGSIDVESQPGVGTCFTIRLPRRTEYSGGQSQCEYYS
jgi:two-component system, NtrC family, sensor kinase